MAGTSVAIGGMRFDWREWDPRPLGADVEWTHPGLASLSDGSVVVFDQTTRELVRLDGEGRETDRASLAAACAHGLTATAGDDIWVADTGVRMKVIDGVEIREEEPGSVFRVRSDGAVDQRLTSPRHAAYEEGAYIPTGVAVAEGSVGGNSDIWVADGYGQSLVHRFSSGGDLLGTIDGSEGGGRFDRCHDVCIDARGSEPRLLVTDRSNHRVAAYDLEGRFIKLIGVGEMRMPSAFAVAGDLLVVAELWSRMSVYDPHDRLVGYIGDGEVAWEEDAWPNRLEDGRVVRRGVQPGRFNAPHGLDAGPDGSLYVAEWSLGGRIVRLAPADR